MPLALLTSVTLGGLQGDPDGIGIFKCLDGDDCQRELYDYGPITSDYPHFPVMTEERWCLHNDYKTSSVVCQNGGISHTTHRISIRIRVLFTLIIQVERRAIGLCCQDELRQLWETS